MGRTIIISNRLPVKVHKKGSELQYKTSEGGLATGLSSVYKKGDNLWVGWPGLYVSSEDTREQITEDLKDENMHPVFLTKADITDYYEGFSNETLWPNFHYFSQYVTYNKQYWEAYERVNRKFLDEVLKVARPNDTIWVHDYQLMLLPKLLREQLPNISIGFFLHIPFPSYEVFRLLPWRKALLEGVLGADLIGFHTFDYMRHFLSAVTRICGFNNTHGQIETQDRTIVADAFPMGIDYGKYAEAAASAIVKKRELQFRQSFGKQRIILSIDRLDYTKGIAQRLEAFEKFLIKYPGFIEKVTLLMLVVPSRDQVPQYQQLKEQVDEMVGRINARFRTISWTPIQYFYRSFPLESLSALYRIADVALVTPMRDGMNLVAKEYIASRTDNTGVLILSEMAGAAIELSEALLINPNDMDQMVESLEQALTMPAEEQEVHIKTMRKTVKRYNVHHWVKLFMCRLEKIKVKQRSHSTIKIDQKVATTIVKDYKKKHSRLLFLDYDGTLTPFKSEPHLASPDNTVLHLLQNLGSAHHNRVVIISGRDRHTLEKWLGHLPVDIIAEHGIWLREQGKEWRMIQQLQNEWKKDIKPVLDLFVSRTPGSFIEEKDYSLVWHYRKVETGLADLRMRELTSHLTYMVANMDLQVLEGHKVVEIKNIEVNKGRATQKWLSKFPHDFTMAIGDDWTDEDIFKAMPETAYTIRVGSSRTAARYYFERCLEVRQLLQMMAEDEMQILRAAV